MLINIYFNIFGDGCIIFPIISPDHTYLSLVFDLLILVVAIFVEYKLDKRKGG